MTQYYTVGEFAKRIGKSVKTLQRWDKSGKLVAKRDLAGNRVYDDTDLRLVRGDKQTMTPEQVDVFVQRVVDTKGVAFNEPNEVDAFVDGVVAALSALGYDNDWLDGLRSAQDEPSLRTQLQQLIESRKEL